MCITYSSHLIIIICSFFSLAHDFLCTRISHIWLHMCLSFDSFFTKPPLQFFHLPPHTNSSPLSSLALFVCSLFRVSFVFVFAFRVAYWRFYLFSVFCAFSYMLKILEFIFFFFFFFAQNLFQFSLILYFVIFFYELLAHLHARVSRCFPALPPALPLSGSRCVWPFGFVAYFH